MEFTVKGPATTLVGCDVGDGPALVVAVGSGSTRAQSAPIFASLGSNIRTVSADYRGMGCSGDAPGPWTMADYAADLLAIFDERGLEDAHLFGISFGGMVALEFAVTHPERVRRLALWCTSAGGALGSSYPLHTVENLPPRERDLMRLRLVDSRFDPEWLASHDNDRRLVQARIAPPVDGVVVAETPAYRLQLAARAGHDVSERLGALGMEVLLGGGRHDMLAPPSNIEALAGALRRPRIEWYEGGHLFFFQDHRCWDDLRSFFDAP